MDFEAKKEGKGWRAVFELCKAGGEFGGRDGGL